MKINVRDAVEKDFAAILALVKELATFQGMPERVVNTVDKMKAEQQYFRCLVAENEQNEIVGIATYFFAYYTWVGKSLYLDDLFVKELYRGQKIGSMLLNRLFEIAKIEGCGRVRWLVSSWNTDAIKFYESRHAEIDKEIFICDFDERGIRLYLEEK